MKKFLIIILSFIIISGCTTYSHRSGNNSNLTTDSKFCQATANSQAPTYICRNPLLCTPEETSYAWSQIAKNTGIYDQCMISKGYQAQ